MRGAGLIETGRGLGPGAHVCWVYDDRNELCEAGVEFLREGLSLGQRALYIGDGEHAELCSELTALGDVDVLIGASTLEVSSVAAVYATVSTSTASQAGVYALATQTAMKDGYTGLRVVADATSLVREPDERAEFARYEHTVDRLMAGGLPLSAMCAYDRRVLGVEACDEIACVHPYTRGATTPFRVFAIDTETIAVVGEVDALCAGEFAAAIEHALEAHDGDEAGVDCSGLDFIDQRSLVSFNAAAERASVRVRIIGLRDGVARVTDLLSLSHVRLA